MIDGNNFDVLKQPSKERAIKHFAKVLNVPVTDRITIIEHIVFGEIDLRENGLPYKER